MSAFPAAAGVPRLVVTSTTVNSRHQPLGIAAGDISFSWTLSADRRGAVQQAYEVRVTSPSSRRTVWESGRVSSPQQVDVRLPDAIPLKSATRYLWQVRVWDGGGVPSRWSTASWFETGLLADQDWTGAAWIGSGSDSAGNAAALPLLRRDLQLRGRPVRARLYATAMGLYQVWINGQEVGDQVLAPGWTDYRKRFLVQTYDVTHLLVPGRNAIGAALGDGWFRGKVGLGWHAAYGRELAFRAKLRVTYRDGTSQDFDTDGGWSTAQGPFTQADLQDGEHFDQRLEHPGWTGAGHDDGSWKPVHVGPEVDAVLVPQPDEPVRVTALRPAERRSPSPQQGFIYDFGQNLVGVVRIRMVGRTGQTVTFRYAEELYRRGERAGQLYTENLRSAAATDRFTFARDGEVTYQPRFTQHGFRYVEVIGIDSAPALEEVKAVVTGSDLPAIGELRLSHPMLDRLVSNIRWGARSNFLSIPTDTPARDERLGWTGDISVFAPTASRLYDTRGFLSKWMDDVRDAQRADGNIPAIVPQPGNAFEETGVGWSDAFITVPHAVWRASGDTQILRRNWPAIRRFYDFVHRSATGDGNLLEEGRSSWFSGDWLQLETVDRLQEHRLIATAYFAQNTRMMAEMARALGEAGQATQWEALARSIADAFVQAYRRSDGSLELGTQTAYAMALGMDLINDSRQRAETADQFVGKLASDNHHLKTGFLGTPWLLPALSSIGRDDLAMRLLLNEDYPSWGFEIRMGATTMWERWNSIRADGEFGPVDMNSFNHYAYGAVGEWMFERLGGLVIVEAGYRKVRIEPLVTDPRVRQASASIRTPYGRIAIDWQQSSDALRATVQVPVGVDAEFVVPCLDVGGVREGGLPLRKAAGVLAVTTLDGRLRARLSAGTYEFLLPHAQPTRSVASQQGELPGLKRLVGGATEGRRAISMAQPHLALHMQPS